MVASTRVRRGTDGFLGSFAEEVTVRVEGLFVVLKTFFIHSPPKPTSTPSFLLILSV